MHERARKTKGDLFSPFQSRETPIYPVQKPLRLERQGREI